jgi:hypothetical protein
MHVVIAQGAWLAGPRRLGATIIVAPFLFGFFLLVIMPSCLLYGNFFFLPHIFDSHFAFNMSRGVYKVFAQDLWLGWPRRLDAIMAVGHPVPDLKYFEERPPILPLDGST